MKNIPEEQRTRKNSMKFLEQDTEAKIIKIENDERSNSIIKTNIDLFKTSISKLKK
jgi:hypothetical protein